MSNVPSAKKYIQIESVQTRRPVSESLEQTMAGSMNYCLDKSDFYANKTIKEVEFFTSGTWTPPVDVVGSVVTIFAMGGGGGGQTGGGSGGGGAIMKVSTSLITSALPIAITIGAGGAPGSPASNGGNTLFGSTIVGAGADWAAFNSSFQTGGGLGGTLLIVANPGARSEAYPGGAGGGYLGGGGGGASSLAQGAAGGVNGAVGNDGTGPGSGAGGGGNGRSGGTGGPGYLKIVYISGF
jgi:hypothetical protein